jgi:flagellar hook-associated protein 2
MQVGSTGFAMIPVSTAAGTDTLSGLAAYINSQNLGISASVVSTTNGAQLALVPLSTGSMINITDNTSGSGLGFPASYNPSNPPSSGALGFTQATAGQDAKLTVDGIPVDSSSNTVENVIPGVTLTLSGVTDASGTDNPVTLQISPNLTPIATDLNNFVSDWNQLITDVNTGIQWNSSSDTAGPLTGDASADMVQQELLGAISSSMTGNSGLVNLESVGISLQDDGTLSVDSTTLNNALENNFSAVQNLFQGTTSVGSTLSTALTSLTDPVSGPIAVDLSGISSEVTDLNSQISDFQLQLQNTQTQLTDEYNTINTTLEQLPETLASINSQLNALNPSSSSSSS